MSDDHPANGCHRCGRRMSHYKPPSLAGPGVGVCPEHGISYDKAYAGPGSLYGPDKHSA